jgi:homoserine dehydrogenase
MTHYNLAFLGFGNVGRALVQLLDSKRAELRDKYALEFTFTGVASRRLGWHANPGGYSAAELLHGDLGTLIGKTQKPFTDMGALEEWLKAAQATVLFENTSMDPHTGQPAIDYLRTALNAGVHVVTANKGPVRPRLPRAA